MKGNEKTDRGQLQGCGCKFRVEDNDGRGRKDWQRITVGIVDVKTTQKTTASVLVHWKMRTALDGGMMLGKRSLSPRRRMIIYT